MIFLVAALMMAAILLFLLLSTIWYSKAYKRLYQYKLAGEISVTEKERKRIAADLHDDLGPLLAITKLQAESIYNEQGSNRLVLKEIISNIEYAICSMERVNMVLVPPLLQKKGLKNALKALVQQLQVIHTIQITLICKQIPIIHKKEIELSVYRIVQELVNNVLKHSRASEINIAIRADVHFLHIHVRDNGVGFDLHDMQQNAKGLGLQSITNRAELLRGTLQIEAMPGEGVHAVVQIPLKNILL